MTIMTLSVENEIFTVNDKSPLVGKLINNGLYIYEVYGILEPTKKNLKAFNNLYGFTPTTGDIHVGKCLFSVDKGLTLLGEDERDTFVLIADTTQAEVTTQEELIKAQKEYTFRLKIMTESILKLKINKAKDVLDWIKILVK